jgi:urate oxidase
MSAPATRMAYALARRGQRTAVSAGLANLSVLKTTQSGYAGFARDALTSLPETRERILATVVAATWTYAQPPPAYDAAYEATQAALCETFFGPARGGVYSPGVQATLYAMGAAALARVPQMDSITLTLPNLHFLPLLPCGIPFEDDVYVSTSEPHGQIQATVTRSATYSPQARL